MRVTAQQVTCDLIDGAFDHPARPLLITGPPGSGRTTILRYARSVAEARRLTVGTDLPTAGDCEAVLLDDAQTLPADRLDRFLGAVPAGTVVILAGTVPEQVRDRVRVHHLPPLDLREALALLDSCPGRLAGRERREVADLAEGNPRALIALHAAVSRGAHRDDGSRLPDTGPIHATYAPVFAALSPAARRLLHTAALALPDEPAIVVRAASGTDPAAWAEITRPALILHCDGRITFPDPLVRVAARHAVPLAGRQELEARLSAATPDPVRSAWYRAILDAPRRVADLEMVARAGVPGIDVVRCWESAARLLRDPAAASEFLLRAAVAALGAADPGRVAWLGRRIAAGTDDPDLLAAGAAVTAVALSRCGAAEAALTVLTGAGADRSRLHPDTAALLDVVGRRIAEQLGTAEGRRPPVPGTTSGGVVAVLVEALAGDTVDSAEDDVPGPLPPAVRRARDPGPVGLYAEAVTEYAGHLVDAARWDEALDLIDRLDRHATLGRWTAIEVELAALRATVRALRGEPGDAPALGRSWHVLDLAENRAAHLRLLRAAGLGAMAAGDWAAGYRHFRAMFTATGAPLHGELSVCSLADLAMAAVRCGRRDEAALVVEAVQLHQDGTGSTRLRLLLHRALALTGDRDTERHHRLAVIDPAGEQWPLERALGRLHYGQWLRRHRRPSDARTVVQAALATFERLGARAYAEMARTELRAGGVVLATEGPSTPDPLARLTPQERQVVVLAAEGLPNRAIAERLLISARTVGCHLYKAYPKLGIDGRHQLGNLVAG